jgi:lipoprotein Spr
MTTIVAGIPDSFWRMTYAGARYPGAPTLQDDLESGNCQVFAYQLLRHFGRVVPDLRSSELWDDHLATERVSDLRPLDLLLFGKTGDAYGAHVAVYVGDGQAIHLAKAAGKPEVWPLSQFAERPAYAVFIGAKRTLR